LACTAALSQVGHFTLEHSTKRYSALHEVSASSLVVAYTLSLVVAYTLSLVVASTLSLMIAHTVQRCFRH